jgi:hypothetical protein
MISGNLHADAEQLYLDSGVVKVADFGLSKSLVPVDRHGQMSMSLTQVGAAQWGKVQHSTSQCSAAHHSAAQRSTSGK